MFGDGTDELHPDAAAVAIDLGATDPVGKADDLDIVVRGKPDRRGDLEGGTALRNVHHFAAAHGDAAQAGADGHDARRAADIETLPFAFVHFRTYRRQMCSILHGIPLFAPCGGFLKGRLQQKRCGAVNQDTKFL